LCVSVCVFLSVTCSCMCLSQCVCVCLSLTVCVANSQCYETEKSWLLGYLFKKKKLEELNKAFKQAFPSSLFEQPHRQLKDMKRVSEIYSFANELRKERKDAKGFDHLAIIHHLLSDKELLAASQELVGLREDLDYLAKNLGKYPKTLKKLNIIPSSLGSLCRNNLLTMSDLEFNKFIRYIHLQQKIAKDFSSIPSFSYAYAMKSIEDLVTAQMTYLLDGRLVDFYENNRATAKALRDIIRNKQRFPKEEFSKLKEAFPCILAGIRDYAEYIPLEPEIFDLVIIDESCVSQCVSLSMHVCLSHCVSASVLCVYF